MKTKDLRELGNFKEISEILGVKGVCQKGHLKQKI